MLQQDYLSSTGANPLQNWVITSNTLASTTTKAINKIHHTTPAAATKINSTNSNQRKPKREYFEDLKGYAYTLTGRSAITYYGAGNRVTNGRSGGIKSSFCVKPWY